MLTTLLDLALPRRCGGCGSEGSTLCGACQDELMRELRAGPAPARPVPAPPALPPAAAATLYAGAARALVLAHKERGRSELARPLGLLLAGAVVSVAPPGRYVLVTVPTSPAARRRRGRDPLRDLARAALPVLRALGHEVALVPLLRVAGRPRDQAGLGGAERAVNLAGVFAPRSGDPGRPVVLVDDVLTTGATLSEAARATRTAGATVHAAAVIAGTVLGPRPLAGEVTATSAAFDPPLGAESS